MEEESFIPLHLRDRHPHHVEIYNREDRQQYGDNLPNDFQSQLSEQIYLHTENNDLTPLRELWKSASFDRTQFFRNFGDIAALMNVEVDFEAVKGMLPFWDPSYRCFVFNECDMVPTVEECAQLLCIEYNPETKIYKKSQKKGLIGKLARIMGIQKKDFDGILKEQNESIVITSRFLIDFIKNRPGHPNTGCILALLIYGLVIFPKSIGHIDHWVIDLVEQVLAGFNPVPAILAEIIRSLNYCRTTGEGRIKGCPQLLTVWFKSHLCASQFKFQNFRKRDRRPIKDFINSQQAPLKTKGEWVQTLGSLVSEDVTWRAHWMERKRVVYRWGKNRPWVPLIGPWGVISYCPLLVLRQFGSTQFIPATHGLRDVDFDFKKPGAHKEMTELINLCKEVNQVDTSHFSNQTIPEYPEWHRQRVKDLKLPPPLDPNATFGPRMEDEMARLVIENQRLREGVVVRELEEKKRKLEEAVALEKERADKLAEEQAMIQYFASSETHGKEKAKRECRKLKATIAEERGEIAFLMQKVNDYQEDERFTRRRLRDEKDLVDMMSTQVASLSRDLRKARKGKELAERSSKGEAVLKEKIDKLENTLYLVSEQASENLIKYEDLKEQCDSLKDRFVDRHDTACRLMIQLKEASERAKELRKEAEALHNMLVPMDSIDQDVLNHLENTIVQYDEIIRYYSYASNGPTM